MSDILSNEQKNGLKNIKMIKIFFVALLIRVVVYLFMLNFYGNPSFMTFDSWEYFYNSQDLIVWKNATDAAVR